MVLELALRFTERAMRLERSNEKETNNLENNLLAVSNDSKVCEKKEENKSERNESVQIKAREHLLPLLTEKPYCPQSRCFFFFNKYIVSSFNFFNIVNTRYL